MATSPHKPGTTSAPSQPGARRGRPGYDTAAVVHIAVELFTKHGYDATSMEMLAERLGISKSGIYHHVPSKVDILRMGLDHALGPLEEVFATHEQATGPADQRLRELMRATLDILFSRLPYVTMLLRLRGNSPVEVAAIERRRHLDRLAAVIVAQAQEEGSISADLDPHTVARYLFGTINSLIDWIRPTGGPSDERIKRDVLELLFAGLSVR